MPEPTPTDAPPCARCRDLEGLLAKALDRIAALEGLAVRVKDLEAQLKRNSTNSNQPPSADPPGVERPKKPPTGRKQGGQPGHDGHSRQMVDASRVTRRVPIFPATCTGCSKPLTVPASGAPSARPVRHQVFDLPAVPAEVTEYELHALRCPDCGKATRADLPADAPRGCVGARLQALLTLLVARAGASRRAAVEVLSDVLQAPISLGAVSELEAQTTAALDEPYQEVVAAVRAAPVAHVDESGWRERARKCWIWTAATTTLAVFRIDPERSRAAFERLLGGDFAGTIVTDRWSAYAHVDARRRAICWAHLKRDFQKLVDRDAAAKSLGEWGLREVALLFHAWRRFERREIQRDELLREIAPVKARVGRLLKRCRDSDDTKAAGFARNVLGVWAALWTFSRQAGVEPTNNRAERVIRSPVVWRKTSFGTASPRGSRFVERVLTVVATLRSQRRSVFAWLVQRFQAVRAGLAGQGLVSMPGYN